MEAINRAYEQIMKNKSAYFVEDFRNSYRYVVRDIDIEIFIDDITDKIISAFPARTQINFNNL